MSNFWPRKWSQLRSKCEHWYSKRGIFKHHLTETLLFTRWSPNESDRFEEWWGICYMHAVPELTWFKEFINILRHFYDVCTRTAFWPAQQGVLKSTICPPNSTAEWTSRFKRLTTSTIGVKKSLCRSLGCTWYLHQLTPEIWYAIFPLGCWTCVRNWLRRFDEDDFGW